MFAGIRQKTSYAIRDAGVLAGIEPRFFKRARGARIVVYHGICRKDPTRFNNIFLTLKTFEAHLQFYKKYFNVISLDDYYAQRFCNDRFNICISFDDGYATNHKYVLPLLQQYEMPASFSVTAIRDAGYDILWNDFLGIIHKYGPEKLSYRDELFRKERFYRHFKRYISVSGNNSLMEQLRSGGFQIKSAMMESLTHCVSFRENDAEEDYWLQMTGTQIRELSASKWATVCCHGYYHNDLAKISLAEAENEMTNAKRYLEEVTSKEINVLAFPYGMYSSAVIASAKKTGFTKLLAVDFHFQEDRSDPAMRERLLVNPFVSLSNQMFAIVNGINTF